LCREIRRTIIERGCKPDRVHQMMPHAGLRLREIEPTVGVTVTFDSEETLSADQQRDGWQAILNNSKRYQNEA
jgi:hypothetical protein